MVLAHNTGAGTATYQVRRAKIELAAAATHFHTGQETVSVDPAGINGRIYPVYISGDAPTPVTLQVTAGTDSVSAVLIAVISADGVTGAGSLSEYLNTRKLVQLEGGTLGTDATLVADAGASGSGNNTVNVSYGTTSIATRINVGVTTLLGSLQGKSFDVYVRASHTVASTTSTLSLSTRYEGVANLAAEVRSADVTFASNASMANVYKDIKLGTITLPPLSYGGLRLHVLAARTVGTGALRLDALTLVPADDAVSLLNVTSGYWAATGESFYSDPELEFVEKLGTDDAYQRAGVTLKGPQPVTLQPGLNLLYMAVMGLVGSTMEVSILAQTATVRHRYKPRYYA